MSEIKTHINAAELTGWRIAHKTKPVKAKPMASLMADQSMYAKFMLSTLEGIQNIKPDSMVCLGADDDVWQQARDKLLKVYTVTEITPDGWLICHPKPEATRQVIEATSRLVFGGDEFVLVKTHWGEKQPDGTFAQTGKVGDYILRSLEDATDTWIVARKVFVNTYEAVSAESEDASIKLPTDRARQS